MRRLIKIAMIACFLVAGFYFADLGSALGGGPSADAKPVAPARKLVAAKFPAGAPAIPLPAGFQSPCANAREHTLRLPTSVPPAQFVDFEKQIFAFLQNGVYKSLGWCQDKGVRDTGPFVQGQYYGTHRAVRIFYSPKAMQWLTGGRQGTMPDGAIIIKEHYSPPAARYAGLADDQLPKVTDWTVMMKDSRGSKDGWFWGEFFDGMTFDDDSFPFDYPWAGFGLYCLRCHSAAEEELTFSSLRNIKGFPGQPITYFDDGSWQGTPPLANYHHGRLSRPGPKQQAQADPDFLRLYNSIPGVPLSEVQTMPSETYDHVVAPASGPGQYISSSQCMSCHGVLNGPFGPVMYLPSGPTHDYGDPGANVSPYTEWRWSPMGLAGRDPIFFAQLESEFAFAKTLPSPANEQVITTLRNGCLTCHGAMGKRQLDIDTPGGGDFQLDYLQLTDRSDSHFKYGALARDGISCTICHRAKQDDYPQGVPPLQYFLENSITGHFQADTPDKVFGPFKDNEIAPLAMQNALGIKPQFNSYLQSSRMCGSCHTIDLPVVDGKPGQKSLEQVTYLEWLNSQYQNEFGSPGPNAVSCQGCHMPGNYHSEKKNLNVAQLKQKIAIIQDQDYPASDNQAPVDQRTVPVRQQGYTRHTFLGLNVLLLEMFSQFNDVLGVRTQDYMSGSKTAIQDTIDNFAQQAQELTAKLSVTATASGAQQINARVTVANLAGHRFPSGVGFRRAFIELLVFENKNSQQNLVWASGRTNNLGVIVDGNGAPLPSEFFTEFKDIGGNTFQHFQPHYQVINAQDQVQIYEELTQNAQGKFTTSFVRRDKTIKDNRLLPVGWTQTGPDPSLSGRFLESTFPEGAEVLVDPDYTSNAGLGTDRVTYAITLPAEVDATKCTVQATLYYQSMPPYYLNDRFKAAPDGVATKRLYYLTSNLELDGTPVENWKLKVVQATAPATSLLAGGPLPTPTPVPPGNHPVLILAPSGHGSHHFGPINLTVRLGAQIERGTLRAFLNGRDVTRLFKPASSLACTFTVCDLVATATPKDGLIQGRNDLRVEVRGSGNARSSASQVFFIR